MRSNLATLLVVPLSYIFFTALINGMNQLFSEVTKLTILGLWQLRTIQFIPVLSNAK